MADERDTKKHHGGVLETAAKAIGTMAGKVASLTGAVADPPPTETKERKEGLFKADYLGSGTFLISKPKRKSAKLRQTRLKGRVRGART